MILFSIYRACNIARYFTVIYYNEFSTHLHQINDKTTEVLFNMGFPKPEILYTDMSTISFEASESSKLSYANKHSTKIE